MAWTELKEDKALLSPELPKLLTKLAKEMWPLVAFLRKALA